ncbi:hypothetical protein [Agrococcus sp. Marseille-Q4369]|uniref:hypothetical protein n=1 Tax=Agrococcus sp. Marseille-Q4369 TaxID=2810513 RepID=UPI001B8C0DAA|nr:hypothetical protein [Agrococcus sp. Marseille-Q4369]QUW18228.1 hypothetical protein JSQ78_10375 [Agrococcus sp. Marseille-Q4369]
MEQRPPESFDDWQQWIEEEYLRTSGPVLLFADDESFERRLGSGGIYAAAALAAAVRSRIDLRASRAFDPLKPAADAWRRSSQACPPPVLPVLLLSVYAATRMHTNEKFTAHNYYDRLAEAVVLGDTDHDPAAIRTTLSEGFPQVADWWRLLHGWIENGAGSRGKSTIRSHPRLTRIGYPLSQAIVREADKAALTQFFERSLTVHDAVPDVDRLVLLLQLWAGRRTELGAAFRHALGSRLSTDEDAASLARMLGEIVAELAAAWDGIVRTNDGRQRLRLRVVLDFDRWERSWRVFGPTGPTVLTAVVGDESVELTKDDESGYYFGTELPSGDDLLLRNGWSVLAGAARLVHRGADFLLFRADRHLGAWSSVESLIPFEAHALAVARRLAPVVHDALRDAGVEFALAPEASAAELVPGYELFLYVTVLDVGIWEDAMRRADLADVEELSIELAGRPRLVNGLRAPALLGPRAYIEGAAPDLLIPAGIEPRAVEVSLNGVRQVFQQSSVGRELSRIPMGSGPYRLVVENTELDFEILSLDELAHALGDGRFAQANDFSSLQPDALCRTGARAPEARRGRDRYCWLMEDDSVREFAEPDEPALLDALGLRGAGVFTPQVPPGAIWLASSRRGRWFCDPIEEALSGFDTEFDVPALWTRRARSEMAGAFWARQLGESR